MIGEAIAISTVASTLKITSGILSVMGVVFGVFKVINWLKTTFTRIDNNVVELKNSMDTHILGLREDIKVQTSTIASALSEQRADFRTFYAPTMLMQLQQQMNPAAV